MLYLPVRMLQAGIVRMLRAGIVFGGCGCLSVRLSVCPCVRLSAQNFENYSSETDVTWYDCGPW